MAEKCGAGVVSGFAPRSRWLVAGLFGFLET